LVFFFFFFFFFFESADSFLLLFLFFVLSCFFVVPFVLTASSGTRPKSACAGGESADSTGASEPSTSPKLRPSPA